MLRHVRKFHDGKWTCSTCEKVFPREDNFLYHQRTCEFRSTGKRPSPEQLGGGQSKRPRISNVQWRSQALDGVVDHFINELTKSKQTPDTIMDTFRDELLTFKDNIESELERKHGLKIILACHIEFYQASDPSFLTEPPVVFNTSPIQILISSDIFEALYTAHRDILRKIDEFQQRGSGWVIHRFLRLDLHSHLYDPLRASSYIQLPEDIARKHAVVNIQNNDEKCFIWSVLACLHADEVTNNPGAVYHYRPYENELNMDGIPMPMSLKSIPKFERQNDISVSVYAWEERKKGCDGKFYLLLQ